MRKASVQTNPQAHYSPHSCYKSSTVIRIINSTNTNSTFQTLILELRDAGKILREIRQTPLDKYRQSRRNDPENKGLKQTLEQDSAVLLKANEPFKGSEENKSTECVVMVSQVDIILL